MMPGATALYFPEVGPAWEDWVQVVSVGNEPAKVLVIARHVQNNNPVWPEEKTVNPFGGWTPSVEAIKVNSSMRFRADQSIVAERHVHGGTNILDFVGVAVEYETVGQCLFFRSLFQALGIGSAF